MTTSAQWQRTLDAVVVIAEEIARLSPDCADRAMQIVRLIRAVDPPARRGGAATTDDMDDDEDQELGIGPLHRNKSQDRV
ncbi:hypothetical protein [Methylobacterium nonmethylotrophicum]|uniref:Uncharacterized protein n=1 Tax=Methylobacterium nonmethylotrophicum TaxID=1141884 RepID=A0A4Z0NG95_9HYPH|nr:hypothetical protein [Methylobacterium nonmethylotrophicum]TGD94245.1 hypothetical protein EU555_32440 [Methylobacterium nonmethylotrophicum]